MTTSEQQIDAALSTPEAQQRIEWRAWELLSHGTCVLVGDAFDVAARFERESETRCPAWCARRRELERGTKGEYVRATP